MLCARRTNKEGWMQIRHGCREWEAWCLWVAGSSSVRHPMFDDSTFDVRRSGCVPAHERRAEGRDCRVADGRGRSGRPVLFRRHGPFSRVPLPRARSIGRGRERQGRLS